MDKLITNNGKVYREVNLGNVFLGHMEAPAEPGEPSMSWTGPKIKWEDINRVKALFEWSNDVHRCEMQVLWYFNLTTGEWKPWAPPQRENGMETSLVAGDEFNDQRLSQVGPGFSEAGTWHHHCRSGAFQSGGDHTDESRNRWNGLHITLGGMGTDAYSIHPRVWVKANGCPGAFYPATLSEWIDMPPGYEGLYLPADAAEAIIKHFLARPVKWQEVDIPEIWQTNLRKREVWTPGKSVQVYGGACWDARPWEADTNALLSALDDKAFKWGLHQEDMLASIDLFDEIDTLMKKHAVYTISRLKKLYEDHIMDITDTTEAETTDSKDDGPFGGWLVK
jgi:hypothetical protein